MSSENYHNRTKPVVLGTGLVALDLVISANPDVPINYWAGGTCGNVLTILSYLGWEAYPVARLNGSSASLRVKDDLSKWGVKLDFATTAPASSTPIIVQEISRSENGESAHKFSWICPKCGSSLPHHKAVTLEAAEVVAKQITASSAFFFDRVSPAAILLAKRCKALGAVVIFEPSTKPDKLEEFEEAVNLADILKYSSERFQDFINLKGDSSCLLEVKTLGRDGLMFRSRMFAESSDWSLLPPLQATEVKDSCGCGDWTTGGLISRLCSAGLQGLKHQRLEDLIHALNYGQELASWNCRFEGARGGMYESSGISFFEDKKSTLCPACGRD